MNRLNRSLLFSFFFPDRGLFTFGKMLRTIKWERKLIPYYIRIDKEGNICTIENWKENLVDRYFVSKYYKSRKSVKIYTEIIAREKVVLLQLCKWKSVTDDRC